MIAEWMDAHRGLRWWPAKTMYWLGVLVLVHLIVAASVLVIWAAFWFLKHA